MEDIFDLHRSLIENKTVEETEVLFSSFEKHYFDAKKSTNSNLSVESFVELQDMILIVELLLKENGFSLKDAILANIQKNNML